MAEASSTGTKTEKKKPKPQAPPPADTALMAWRTWAIVGAVLVGGVVAWKLIGSSYRSDVETICNAEKGSGYTVEKDMSKVSQWIRSHLATPEGNELFATLTDAKLAEKAKKLQAEATTLKIGSCSMVASYQQLAAEGEYRGDVQHLCSSLSFPKFAELDDADRLAKLQDWIEKQAKSPRTKEISDALRQAPPVERARLLREAASKLDIFTCENAKVLESPQAVPPPRGPPQVRVYSEPQLIGPLKPDDMAKALVEATPAMNDCYRKGLAKSDNLEGRLAIKMKIDTDGKVTDATPADSTVPDRETIVCILQALKGMKLPSNPGPLQTAFVPLELSTKPSPVQAPGTMQMPHSP